MSFKAVVAFLSSLLFISLVNGGDNCDLLGVNLYDELNCTPNTIKGYNCPISYDCPEYKIDPNHCTFLGNRYNVEDLINGTSYCNVACRCEGNNSFNCAIVDCFWGDVKPGCYRAYTLRECCAAYPEKCPPFDDVPKCEYEGKSYYKGQIIDTGDTCWNCVCQEGFRGIMEEPFCIRRPCDVELNYSQQIAEGCAPIYRKTYKALCCPSSFLCPDQVEELTVQTPESESCDKGKPQCSFGERKFNINDSFLASYKEYSNNQTTTCTCRLPPLMSCITNY